MQSAWPLRSAPHHLACRITLQPWAEFPASPGRFVHGACGFHSPGYPAVLITVKVITGAARGSMIRASCGLMCGSPAAATLPRSYRLNCADGCLDPLPHPSIDKTVPLIPATCHHLSLHQISCYFHIRLCVYFGKEKLSRMINRAEGSIHSILVLERVDQWECELVS